MNIVRIDIHKLNVAISQPMRVPLGMALSK